MLPAPRFRMACFSRINCTASIPTSEPFGILCTTQSTPDSSCQIIPAQPAECQQGLRDEFLSVWMRRFPAHAK